MFNPYEPVSADNPLPLGVDGGHNRFEPVSDDNPIPVSLRNYQGDAVTIAFSVGQSAIPLIVPSSGNIGNNGALTLNRAQQDFYTAGCYMYFPAAAIVAGSAAGFYFVVMDTDTTHGTIYNNTYTSGVPTIPASPTAFATTGPGNYTAPTGLVDALVLTVPAGAMGINGRLEVKGMFAHNNNANNKNYELKFGALFLVNNAATSSARAGFEHWVQNRGIATKQTASGPSLGSGVGATSGAENNSSIDTTAAVSITLRMGHADTGDFCSLSFFSVDCIPGD